MRLQKNYYFFFNDTATTEIYTLSLHDALPIYDAPAGGGARGGERRGRPAGLADVRRPPRRSEEHTSELLSRQYLVCRLLLEKKQVGARPYAWPGSPDLTLHRLDTGHAHA